MITLQLKSNIPSQYKLNSLTKSQYLNKHSNDKFELNIQAVAKIDNKAKSLSFCGLLGMLFQLSPEQKLKQAEEIIAKALKLTNSKRKLEELLKAYKMQGEALAENSDKSPLIKSIVPLIEALSFKEGKDLKRTLCNEGLGILEKSPDHQVYRTLSYHALQVVSDSKEELTLVENEINYIKKHRVNKEILLQNLLSNAARLSEELHDLPKAEKYLAELIEKKQNKSELQRELSGAFAKLALIQKRLGKDSEAVMNYKKAVGFCEKVLDSLKTKDGKYPVGAVYGFTGPGEAGSGYGDIIKCAKVYSELAKIDFSYREKEFKLYITAIHTLEEALSELPEDQMYSYIRSKYTEILNKLEQCIKTQQSLMD